MQVANAIATEKKPVLFASGEQNKEDLLTFAQRLGIQNPHVHIRGNTEIAQEITDIADDISPAVVVVDSIQTCVSDDLDADYGTDTQIKAVANWFTSFGKKTKTSIVLVCQVNKEGDLAGPKTLEHLCDGTVYFEQYAKTGPLKEARVLISGKQRFAPMGEERFLEMTANGLREPSKDLMKMIEADENEEED